VGTTADDVSKVVGARVFDMLDPLLRRQLAADIKAGNERRRADKQSKSLWYADDYLREIDFSVLECLTPALARETLREQRRIAAINGKEIEQQAQQAQHQPAQQAEQQAVPAARASIVATSSDVRGDMRRWLAERAGGDESVRAFLAERVLALIESRQLDVAHIVLHEVRRRAIVSEAAAEREEWEQCFDEVLTAGQNAVHERYRGLFAFAPLREQR